MNTYGGRMASRMHALFGGPNVLQQKNHANKFTWFSVAMLKNYLDNWPLAAPPGYIGLCTFT